MFCLRSPGHYLRSWPSAACVALRVATGQNRRGHTDHAGRDGVREAALVVLLAPFGAPAAQVLATGIVWEGVNHFRRSLAGLTAFLLRYAQSRPQGS